MRLFKSIFLFKIKKNPRSTLCFFQKSSGKKRLKCRAMMKRLFDFCLALILILVFLPIFLLVYLAVRLTSKGAAIHWSRRIGQNNCIFLMPKFRSMRVDTPQVATHLMHNPQHYLTPIGSFLRKSSLDELPQLFSILKGDMSFVGPRPALFNQDDLMLLRNQKGIAPLKPGLTGWAQINGRDELPIVEKVRLEEEYLKKQSFGFDLKILWLTFWRVLFKKGVSH